MTYPIIQELIWLLYFLPNNYLVPTICMKLKNSGKSDSVTESAMKIRDTFVFWKVFSSLNLIEYLVFNSLNFPIMST